MFELTEEQRKQILQYLWTRPYGEVASIIGMLAAQTLGPRVASNRFQMFRGSRIMELAACGLKLDACCLGLDACYNFLSELGA
jgi:hypothetical protein